MIAFEEPTFDPDHISACGHCLCMTHTLFTGKCGKCGEPKSEVV